MKFLVCAILVLGSSFALAASECAEEGKKFEAKFVPKETNSKENAARSRAGVDYLRKFADVEDKVTEACAKEVLTILLLVDEIEPSPVHVESIETGYVKNKTTYLRASQKFSAEDRTRLRNLLDSVGEPPGK